MLVKSIQMGIVEGDKAKTLEKAVDSIRRCQGADLIVLPELWNIGFMSFDRYVAEAEDADGPTLTTLRRVAEEVRACLHLGSFVEKKRKSFYNSSYLISPEGDILANYRKIHLFGHNSQETRLLTPGNKVTVVDTPLGAIGLATCFDLRFPELFRRMTDKGAEMFLVCSAWPYPRLEDWLMLNRVRALENQCFLISANSVGFNRDARFVGHSMIVNPWGIILSSGGDDESIISAEIDLSEVPSARERFPALSSRCDFLNRDEPGWLPAGF
jgi:predicted amidohydrolase